MSAYTPKDDFLLVTSVSHLDTFTRRLMSSPCLQPGGLPLRAFFNCASAADAFNAVLDSQPGAKWLVWLHQDVVLPAGWEHVFTRALEAAQVRFPNMAVAGVYGVAGQGANAKHAGRVLDRGTKLQGELTLPCAVDSLDELLFAVRVDSGLRLDADLRFDFYATDLVMQAQERGLEAVAIDAFCEHWSDSPRQGVVPQSLIDRIESSAQVFERKWANRFPVTTTCFHIESGGDVASFLRTHFTGTP
jgi:hypothetical protein